MSGRSIKAFLDSNTIISGLLFQGNEATLLELGRVKAVKLLTNDYVIEETRRVLAREEFRLTESEIAELIRYIHECLTIISNPSKETIRDNINLLRDKKDIPVALGAIESNSDYLITGDKELQKNENIKSTTTSKLLKQILPTKQQTEK